jgi:2-polyprenyl-6-methoxyphenol hydroxylase-like FAD-dependent oxidoreductase
MSVENLVRKVLIVGGGVGGMAAAIRFREAGVDVDLVDLDPNWGVYGTGITLSILTLRALCDLGLADDVMKVGNCYDNYLICNADGSVLHESSLPRLYSEDVPAEGGILRPALHTIMKERVLKKGVRVRTGLTVAQLDADDAGVTAAFTDGESGRYDLVVGADGLFSKVRGMIMPDAPKPVFTGQACWRAMFDIPEGWTSGRMFLGEKVKLGFTLCSPDKMYLYLLEHVPDNPWREKAELPGLLRGLMDGFGGEAARLKETIGDDASIIYRPLESVLIEDSWSRGRVVLLGDAVHATTPHLGSGAGAAVEDAIVLVDELASSASVDTALANYDRRRIPRASLVVKNSLKIGEMEMASAPMKDQAALMSASMEVIAQPYR